jgi:hypothetical protein
MAATKAALVNAGIVAAAAAASLITVAATAGSDHGGGRIQAWVRGSDRPTGASPELTGPGGRAVARSFVRPAHANG